MMLFQIAFRLNAEEWVVQPSPENGEWYHYRVFDLDETPKAAETELARAITMTQKSFFSE